MASAFRALLIVILLVVAALACRPASGPSAASAPSGAPTCRARAGLPDPACTPGATNPEVRQDTIGSTICVAGYTSRIRPPVAVTGPLKQRQIAAYGAYAGADPTAYEEDHLISLELGGAPVDPANLWPEARVWPDGSPGAATKDQVENYLRAEICAGRRTLADAQRAIATDWTAIHRQALALGARLENKPPDEQDDQ